MLYDPKKTIVGLQELLTDVYGEKRLISDMLVSVGLSEENISTLRKDALFEFCENIKFALACRFFHLQDGQRLLGALVQKYGLFRNETEALPLGIVNQLRRKAVKRLKTDGKHDGVKILIVLAACKTLGLDEAEILQSDMVDEPPDESNETTLQPNEVPDKPKPDLPQAEFYIQGSFDYGTRLGGYELLMVFGDHKKHIEKSGLTGSSDVSMILEGVIAGLEILKKPCEVMVFSNTLFGLKSLYNKTGLRESIKESAANYELKARLLVMLKEQDHVLDNLVESDMRRIIKDLMI